MSSADGTRKKREAFLVALAQGLSASGASKAAGVPRRTAYNWREADEAFAAEWDAAVDQGTDELEDIAFERARKQSDTLVIFLLKARRPEKYMERQRIESDNVTRHISDEPLSDDEWQDRYSAGVGASEGAAESVN